FLRKHFKGDPDSGDVFNERRAVASFPHGAGCSRTKGRNPVTIGNAFESLQRVECIASACGIQRAGFKYVVTQADGSAILFDNPIYSRLIDRSDLKSNRITPGIDDRKGGLHYATGYRQSAGSEIRLLIPFVVCYRLLPRRAAWSRRCCAARGRLPLWSITTRTGNPPARRFWSCHGKRGLFSGGFRRYS